MKAFSNAKLMPFAAAGATLLLGGFFWLPLGAERPGAFPPTSLAGRTLLFERAPTVSAPPPAAEAPATPSSTPEPPKPVRKPGSKHRTRPKKPGHDAKAISLVPAAPTKAIASEPVSASTATSAAETPVPQASLQDLVERFENDPSRYPLDRSLKKDGITLTLEGVARLDRSYVLKVSVTNETGADFFIKDFAVQAGTVLLASRSDFRILVEPQRQRSGYVVFDKPKPGMAVHIKLKEDGGKNRIVETLVPYPF